MGWRGSLRSLNAATNRMNRDAERQYKAHVKEVQRQNSENEVERQGAFIESLVSVHNSVGKSWNWEKISKVTPRKPKYASENEDIATKNLADYEPNFFARLFKLVEKKKEKLRKKIEYAQKEDRTCHKQKMVDYEYRKKKLGVAEKIIAGDPEGFIEGLTLAEPFKDNPYIGSGISYDIQSPESVVVKVSVNTTEVVPDKLYSVLKSGKLSEKKTPQSRMNEIYLNHVCSSVLRVARETFAVLPVDTVLINATSQMLNLSTGYQEERCILSVYIPRETLNSLNLERIEPGAAMNNFSHNIDFKKTKGLLATSELDIQKFING